MRPLEVDAYTNPILAPIGESPMVQHYFCYKEYDMRPTLHEEILDFIKRRWSKDSDWTTGNCYWFTVILMKRFYGSLDRYYLPILGHFIVGDRKGHYYDWTGEVFPEEEPQYWLDVWLDDPIYAARVENDCMY